MSDYDSCSDGEPCPFDYWECNQTRYNPWFEYCSDVEREDNYYDERCSSEDWDHDWDDWEDNYYDESCSSFVWVDWEDPRYYYKNNQNDTEYPNLIFRYNWSA